MSKALKKLIDINRLREFKNKLVGTGSAYVQTAAVDQTVAGTKTFSEPIVGSVTGSSGSCTGNAATATKLAAKRTINGTSFNGTANITTANWGTARDITIADSTGDNTGEAVSVNGSAAVTLKLPATIKASLDGNAATATSATTAASATTATNATNAAKLGNIASSGYVQTGKVNQTIDGTKTFSAAIVGSVTGNAGSATKLATARTINGTAFNGTANITTANWGTARNISITDGTNTSTAVSVNGSANVSLNLPATIKANLTGNCSGSSGSCTGNAATATRATQDSDGNQINTTYSKVGHTHDDRYYTETEVNNLLKGKANNSEVVHKSGDETIAGTKTFSNGVLLTNVNALMAQNGEYTLVLRNDSRDTYLLMSDKGGVPGTWSDARPLTISNSTGVCSINGNASTATKLATARTIALSGAATGTATGFDGSGNITIPVTSLDASKLTGTASVSTTGNAATASNASKFNGLVTTDFIRTTGNVNQTITGTKTFNSPINSPVTTGAWIDGNRGVAIINSTANAGYNVLFRMKSSHGVFTGCAWNQSYQINYTTDSIVNAGTNATTYTNTLIDENGNATFSNNITVSGTINGNLNGNVTGNAATATKLATARTIALSGAATGTATGFDGSGNITIPVTALSPSAIRAQWYAAYPDGAEAHNAMWGGRDITAAFNNGTVSANIANGTFKDIFPGDYITKAVTIYGNGTPGMTYTVNWVIADCDYWINKGDTPTTAHHVVIVPQAPIFSANMNATNTTEGGYKGSVMYRSIIRASVTGGIVSAFGSDHILMFRDGISNKVDASYVSSGITQWTGTPSWWGEWVSVQCNLMSEKMVYGAPVCSAGAMDNSVATRQMSAFRLSEKLINYNRVTWWLRDVIASAGFAVVDGSGYAAASGASNASGVRPFALLR